MCRWLAPSLLALTLVVGCGGEWAAVPEVGGGTPAQRELLRAVLRSMPPTAVERFELRGETLEVDWAPPRSVRSRWEGLVIAGAFLDRSVERGLPEVSWLAYPDGDVNLDHRATPAGGRRLDALRVALATLAARVRGADVQQLRVYAPLGYAVVLVLRVDEPPRFLREGVEPVLRLLGRSGLDGYYVRVEDGGGRVFELAWAQRLGSFSSWVRPALAGCSPVVPVAGPNLRVPRPPPCPASGFNRDR